MSNCFRMIAHEPLKLWFNYLTGYCSKSRVWMWLLISNLDLHSRVKLYHLVLHSSYDLDIWYSKNSWTVPRSKGGELSSCKLWLHFMLVVFMNQSVCYCESIPMHEPFSWSGNQGDNKWVSQSNHHSMRQSHGPLINMSIRPSLNEAVIQTMNQWASQSDHE